MKMFILKINSDYGYEGHADYNLAISPTKERLEELVNDLENINIAAKDLVNYVTPLISSEQLSIFSTKTIELDQTIGECLNKYNVTKTE